MGGPEASQISELRGTAKWHDPPEGVREEDDLLTGQGMDRPDLLYSVKELYAKNGFTTYTRTHCPHESCTTHNQIPANDL